MTAFTELVLAATSESDADGTPAGRGHLPYPYQERLAEEGLPDLLEVPTGTGKTLAACLPWLYRRRLHPDPQVRVATPRRLVVVLPQRALVEQTHRRVTGWLANLQAHRPGEGWDEVAVHLLLGGASLDDRAWKASPDRDAVFVGTQDMVLSRLLMRGYGESRSAWPMSFGILHTDTQFVFDEVQLMGPGLPTSLQLDGLRTALGTAAPSRSMWMSATIDERLLATPDAPPLTRRVGLGDADREGPLGTRLAATRTVRRLDLPSDPKTQAPDPKRYPAELARRVLEGHRAGTRTIVVCNTVDRATQVYGALRKATPRADLVLLHSRFRPEDRSAHLEAVEGRPGAGGTVVVTTQVLEAGIDLTSALLVTELAPWSSVVQRAGRCNRAGEDVGAELWWTPPPGKSSSAPYPPEDLARSAEALASMEGQAVTSSRLRAAGPEETLPVHPMLRRRDLFDLFDTTPDLSGNDLDVSRWIRDADERTLSVAWRSVDDDGLADDAPAPRREELCPVPVAQLREVLRDQNVRRRGWVREQPDGTWTRARPEDLRPGEIVVMDAASGCYTPEHGWHPASRTPVAPVPLPSVDDAGEESEEQIPADPRSASGVPVLLTDHLRDVREAVASLLDRLTPPGISPDQREAAVAAGMLHDLGKAHPVFAASLHAAGAPSESGPWAKSGTDTRLRHQRRYFRHELAGALVMLHPESRLGEDLPEADLVAYLVAAHHGKVRLSVRSMPGEAEDQVLGVAAGEEFPAVELPDGRTVPGVRLDLDLLRVGGGRGGESWTTRVCRLRDRGDLGPFRVAFLEAVVRAADWTASAGYNRPATNRPAPSRPEATEGGRA